MSKAQGLFITGTDTGVGKTRVTAILAVAFRRRGLSVGVMKPVETGCLVENEEADMVSSVGARARPHPGSPSTTFSSGDHPAYPHGRGQAHAPTLAQDSHFLRQISGCTAPPETVTPYMFREPLAPAIAAQHEGQEIDLDHIAYCYEKLAAKHDIVLVEGAGGLLVPLTRQENFLDLAARLDLPMLVVARNMLGTINHTALTVIVAAQRCRVLGIVLNTVTEEAGDVSQASNAEALQIWGRAPLLGVLPYVPEVTLESLLKQSEGIELEAILG